MTTMKIKLWPQDRDFGYVCGDEGGFFFTWMPTLAETLESVEVDSVDGDGGLDRGDVVALLLKELPDTSRGRKLWGAPLRTITISGNWRKGGPENEWAGTGTVDRHGSIECAADLGGDAYDQIEEQIAEGKTSGRAVVIDRDGREVTYSWEIE